MDRTKIIETLGLVPGGGFSVADMQMVQWGRDVVLECRYRTAAMNAAPDEPVHFRLVFKDCREIKYKVYAHIGEHEQGTVTSVADIAEISLGQGNHRRDANILTNHFGLTVSYGKISIERGEQTYPMQN